jgi:predicted amidophosphoribosyltransferase
LSERIAAGAGKPHVPDLLKRVRAAAGRGRLSRLQRRERASRAFAVSQSRRGQAAGRNILVIDDVFTTGATAAACAQTLLDAGARAVDVLTIARVVRPV